MCISPSLTSIAHSRFIAIFSDSKSRQPTVTLPSFSLRVDTIIISVSIPGRVKAYHHLLARVASIILRFSFLHGWNLRKYCNVSSMQDILSMARVITASLKHSISVIRIVSVLSSTMIDPRMNGNTSMEKL